MATADAAKIPLPDVPQVNPIAVPGSLGNLKNLFQSTKDAQGNFTWLDKQPEDVSQVGEKNETAKFAIIVRNIKSTDSFRAIEAHSIIVQSPWLKKALGKHILTNYPGITCELSRLQFGAPFMPFLHRWAELLSYRKKSDLDDTTRTHINLLHGVLQLEMADNLKAFEDYVHTGVVTFEHLWMLFPPGSIIISGSQGPVAAFELKSAEYEDTYCGKELNLGCEYLDWSGKYFGRASRNICIAQFSGTKPIGTLAAVPLRFHEDRGSLKENLIRRGQKFMSLAGYQYKAYSGIAQTPDGGTERQVFGRIIIDADGYNHISPHRARQVKPMSEEDTNMISKYRDKRKGTANTEGSDKGSPHVGDASVPPTSELCPYHQMLCTPWLLGYSLKMKQWFLFFVDLVSEIIWDSTAFESLVLPEEQKDLILSFTKSQVENRQAFDDVIQGKGKGIVVLLSGSPGIGKTLTAEAVAENMQTPLHTITSGDLGSSPSGVESKLSSVLSLVTRWNAILLIDECDVFLEARSTHDLKRNQIVSIFLRTLEYYEGILFMTTNRASNIDPAFQSRIHVSLRYPDLTVSARRQIWMNIVKARANNLEDTDFDELAIVELNGRQIKNILKTAQLLASKKKVEINRQVIDIVLGIEKGRPQCDSHRGQDELESKQKGAESTKLLGWSRWIWWK